MRLTSAAALGALLTVATTTAPAAALAAAEDPAPSRITARPSNYNPGQGQQFLLRGRMLSENHPVAGVTVRAQTYRNGGWEPLRGAVVTTNDEGRYRLRIVLFQDGDRDVRVVANPAGDDIRTARGYTVVRVWPASQG